MLGSDAVDIIGRACRLPGAPDCAALWRVLADGRCTVSEIGEDRWAKARFYSPRQGERGKSYTFAAGVLDDVWGFDPGVFGLSPREAEQMDPQQRILLQVVWEALEDAGVPASALAGQAVGVYVGVSSPDTATRRAHDVGTSDAFTMTGNTLSLVANRISYVFDWRGPSLIVDTACSSSLVALAQALDALKAGRIDTAIVGGVNLLLSPFPFLGFSAARMLSPDGRCRPFDASGQGYVRAEGAVALLLRRRAAGPIGAGRAHAEVVAAGVNSDGRTSGVSLPSADSQAALLAALYPSAGVSPGDLAFVEAHGTGTRVGDPAEAEAIGRVLGRARRTPLPIGSIKSNIGHLEPAAGLAGMLKAMLALEHDQLPASLFFETPNPSIPFADLNLAVAGRPVPLARTGRPRLAGVSSFGFGGTNAHVILREIRESHHFPARPAQHDTAASANDNCPEFASALLLSAHCRPGLDATSRAYRDRIASGNDVASLAANAAHMRELLGERLAVVADSGTGAIAALDGFLAGTPGPAVVTGRAVARVAEVAFIYAGNGAQWAGMGRLAYAENAIFRDRFDALSRHFADLAGWSLTEALLLDGQADRIASASVAQPLLFAIQAALTDSLAAIGLQPSLVLGHSVGEIAAAYAAGALDERRALRVIHARSTSQELARGFGTMAALGLGEAEARRLLARCHAEAIEIGAVNSPRSVTLSGPRADIEEVAAFAAAEGHRVKVLDLDYPFHSELLAVSRAPLVDALTDMAPAPSRLPFVSTVTGDLLAGEALDAQYWWRNVRAPVRFGEAVARAVALGARVLVELSPRPILQGYLGECLEGVAQQIAVLPSLSPRDAAALDPVRATLARAWVRGARIDHSRATGRPDPTLRLPHYRWQNKPHDVPATAESTSMMQAGAVEHPLLGWRERGGLAEWFTHLDAHESRPFADHRIGGQVYLPGAALAEMALAAAACWLDADRAEVHDLDIRAPLVLAADHMREVRTAIEPASRSLTIASRRRLSDEPWLVHVEARFAAASLATTARAAGARPAAADAQPPFDADAFYEAVRRLGLDYGPRFRRLASLASSEEGGLIVDIADTSETLARGLLIDPIALDAAFQGLLCRLLTTSAAQRRQQGFVPVRIGRIVVQRPGAPVRRAHIGRVRQGPTEACCDVVLLDADGRRIAEARNVRFKASVLVRRRPLADMACHVTATALPLPGIAPVRALPAPADVLARAAAPAAEQTADEEARLLLEAAARRVACDSAGALARDGAIDPARAVRDGRLAAAMQAPLTALLAGLEAVGLAVRDGGAWRLGEAAAALPPLDAIVQTVMAEHPRWWPDCAMLAEAAQLWPRLLGDADAAPLAALPYQPATLEACATASPRRLQPVTRLLAMIERLLTEADRPLGIVELGCGHGALTRPLARLLARHGGRLLALDDDPRAVERLRAELATHCGTAVAATPDLDDAVARHGPIDIVVAADSLDRIVALDRALRSLAGRSADRALVLAACGPSGLFDVVAAGVAAAAIAGPRDTAGDWRHRLATAGVTDLEMVNAAGGALLAGRLERRVASVPGGPVAAALIEIGSSGSDLVAALRARLSAARRPVAAADEIVCVLDAPSAAEAACDALGQRLSALAALLKEVDQRRARVWIVAPGALRGPSNVGNGCPVQAGVAAFARTACNEHGNLDIRVVDAEETLGVTDFAERLARLLREPGMETEIVLGAQVMRAARVARGLPPRAVQLVQPAESPDAAARLELSRVPGRERVAWQRVTRRAPGPSEVEIEIAATGLNFRDCMWSMGLLPEEALEDGFAGPTLGFECSGRIARVGAGVDVLAPGAPVIAFAPAAFASHVTVAVTAVAPVPAGISLEAAATVPVPFITAYYGLVHLAGLEEGETVLVHGGAGGVGLAALQIARWRGARVIATAGSAEKRSLLRLLGAEHVLDSRTLAFADAVTDLTNGAGVDVVLNSLAGEAMERSLALVKPFGRFIELGKRDFYGATRIGLRPFRRNVSYYGVDADQLLAQKPQLAHRLFAELARHLDAGTFVPLPYRTFAAGEIADAFRLMQQSGHIGKIIVTPPAAQDVPVPEAGDPFAADPAGAHLVIGGLGGFGLRTAQWLAERGARRIVLASRSGRPDAEGAAIVEALRAGGVAVELTACDVADAAALSELLDRIRADGPLRGVVHAAMVLDDDLIARLAPQRIAGVLAPKVAGAAHLDRLTRADALQYFVLYSSVTVLIGNPGQAAYVAANGFLEELARQRRAAGLPGLAVGWGGITDAGALVRNAEVGRAIARRTGTQAFTAAEALEALGELLAMGEAAPATLTVAPMSWGAAREQLPLLGKPLYASLLAAEADGKTVRSETIDIGAEIGGLDEAEACSVVRRHLAEEVARIFRMAVADVDPARTLAELGMDSLMGLELRIAVQQRLGSEIPLAAMSGSQSLAEIAARIVATQRARAGDGPTAATGGVAVDLAHQHVGTRVDAGQLAPLMRAIETREADLGVRS